MPCCRCYKGSCSNCVCARLRRPCVNCETTTCSNMTSLQCDTALQSQSNITGKFTVTKKSSANLHQNQQCHHNARSASVTAASLEKPDCFVPSHWTLYHGNVDQAIVQMHVSHKPCLVSVCSSNLWQLASRIVKKTWFDESQWRMEIINVHQVENPVLYRRYITRCKEIRLTTGAGRSPIVPLGRLGGAKDVLTNTLGFPVGQLDSDVNECWLLHGTTADAVGAIAQNGIDLRLANPTGRYGSGIYLAESSIKANIYTDFQRGVAHKLYVFVVRTTLGRPFICNVPHPFRRPPCAEPGCRSLDSCVVHRRFYDSVIGTGVMNQQTHREFVIYDPAQCMPEFVVTYSLWRTDAPYSFK